jgi:hypothetical protein
MKRFIEGEDRRQATLLPDCLEDYVSEDNPVRVIEAFIDGLDLGAQVSGGAQRRNNPQTPLFHVSRLRSSRNQSCRSPSPRHLRHSRPRR